ncbi:MAG: FkbM family methyltransferase [bacterium]
MSTSIPATPSQATRLLQAGVLLLEAEAWDLALAALDRATSPDAPLPHLEYARATALARLGRPAEAADALLKEIRAGQAHADSFRFFLAMAAAIPVFAQLPPEALTRRVLAALDSAVGESGAMDPVHLARLSELVVFLLNDQGRLANAFAALADDEARASLLLIVDTHARHPEQSCAFSLTMAPGQEHEAARSLAAFLDVLGLASRPTMTGLRSLPVAPGPVPGSFVDALAREIAHDQTVWLEDNFDELHLGAYVADRHREDLVGPRPTDQHALPIDLALRYDDLEDFYARLADEPSRQWLVKLFAYRALGFRRVRLPRNTPAYAQGIALASSWAQPGTALPIRFEGLSLPLMDLAPAGIPMRLHASGAGLACVVVQRQYEYNQDGVHVAAAEGDVVIDAGACWGDTTLYFADRVGSRGRVLAAEFIPSNLEILRKNVALNRPATDMIDIIEHPLWRTSGKRLWYVDWGPGSRVADDPARFRADGECTTLSIDDLVRERGVAKVDFIKMDIEGAECDALAGAREVLQRYRPKLAISLYHRPSDFVTIPRYLDSLGMNYRFYLDHHTLYLNESVLFAVPEGR